MKVPSFVVYGLGVLVQGALAFLTVPFLSRLLTTSDFAAWALLDPLITIVPILALGGAQYGQLHAIAGGNLTRAAAFAQLLRLSPVIGIVSLCGGLWCYSVTPVGSNKLLVGTLSATLFFVEAGLAGLQFHSRGAGLAGQFVAAIWVRAGVIAALLLYSLHFERALSLPGYLAIVLAGASAALMQAWRSRPDGESWPSPHSSSTLLASILYGWPIMLVAALSQAALSIDRYILGHTLDSLQLATYVANAKLAGAMSFAIAPVSLWWPRERQVRVPQVEGKNYFAAVIPLGLTYFMVAALGLAWVASYLGAWYSPAYSVDPVLMLILTLGWVCSGLSNMVNIGTLERGRTFLLGFVMIATVAISAGVTMGLVRPLGLYGAAFGGASGQLSSLLMIGVLSNIFYPVPHHWWRLLSLATLGAAACFLVFSSDTLLVRVGSTAAFLVAAVVIARPNVRKFVSLS